MTYNSLYFWGIFLPLFLAVYFLMPGRKTRQAVLLLANILFYYFNGISGLLLLFLVSLIVYVTSRRIEKIYSSYDEEKNGLLPKEQVALFQNYKKRARRYLYGALILVVGILLYVKIGKFLHWNEITELKQFKIRSVLVPLGISYYTFSSVGYLLDIYWRKAVCEHNFIKLFLCMTFFPYIVQGPICKYPKILEQLDQLPGFVYENVCFGAQLFLWGTFKKMVIADRLSMYVNAVTANVSEFAGIEIFLAVIFGTIQLYADFSGCIDMVRGISQALGVEIEKNFNHPFFSKSAAEFWRRWNITLGGWFKDYIYMPIAMNAKFMKLVTWVRKKCGNRIGQNFSSAVPLCVVWVLTGIWHGTGVNYLVWGAYWGALIIVSNWTMPDIKKLNEKLHIDTKSAGFQFFQMLRTSALFCVGRTFTMAGGLRSCLLLWKRLFFEHRIWVLFDGSIYTHGLDQKNFIVCLIGILFMLCVDILQEHISIRETLAKQPLIFRWIIYYGAILTVLVFGIYGAGYDPAGFIYAGF